MDKLFIDTDKDNGGLELVNCHGKRFGWVYGDTKQATKSIADFMALACNSHDGLVEALKNALWHLDPDHDSGHSTIRSDKLINRLQQALANATKED